jgi:hypothetical protein
MAPVPEGYGRSFTERLREEKKPWIWAKKRGVEKCSASRRSY